MGDYVSGVAASDELGVAWPWPRFWARIFDTFLYSVPIGALLGLVFPTLFEADWTQGRFGAYVLGFLALPLVMVLDAAVIAMTGTSPGKAIAGLRVLDLDRQKLTFETAARRNLQVYWKGLAIGIPLLNLVAYGSGYTDVKETGLTTWDQDTDTRVFVVDGSEYRTIFIAVLAIGAMLLDRYLAMTL